MKLAGMNIVVNETAMTQEQHNDLLSAIAECVAEKYQAEKERKETSNG